MKQFLISVVILPRMALYQRLLRYGKVKKKRKTRTKELFTKIPDKINSYSKVITALYPLDYKLKFVITQVALEHYNVVDINLRISPTVKLSL